MMKRILSCLLIAALLLGSCAVAEESWQSVYKSFLQGNGVPADAQGYYVSYVDEDDIPELLIRCGKNEADAVLKVYTVSGWKAVLTGEAPLAFGDPVHIGADIVGIGIVSLHGGIETFDYCVIDGGLQCWPQYKKELKDGAAYEAYVLLPMYGMKDMSGLKSAPERDVKDTNYDVFMSRILVAPGTVIDDFSFTASDGITYSLSGLLKQYDAVLLNFFFIGCIWCERQDVYMEAAYEKYADRIAVVAFSPYDSNSDIAAFKKEMGYTFIMAYDAPGLSDFFSVDGFPTSYMIGSDSAVSEKITTVLEEGVFEGIFEGYLK